MWRPVSILAIAASACSAPAASAPPPTVDGAIGPDSTGGDGGEASDYDPVVEHVSAHGEIWALSDPHGGIDALRALLSSAGLIDTSAGWSGGTATFVVVGDLIDKGDYSLEVIDLLRALEPEAAAAGGRLIVMIGNHEDEFFADPENHKATMTGTGSDGIDNELAVDGIVPGDLASGTDQAGRGRWLRGLPLAARVDNYFFAHAGNTAGDSMPALRSRLASALAGPDGFAADDIIGASSILEAQSWYSDPTTDAAGRANAQALGVDHIVFGHDPGAFNESGHIAVSTNHVLIKIDCAMGLAGSPGQLLHITTRNGVDTAEKVKLSGVRDTLY